MTASPVLAQVEPVLRERLNEAKAAGQVPQDVLFRLTSRSVGNDGERDYYCADGDGEPIICIEPFRAKPTVCD